MRNIYLLLFISISLLLFAEDKFALVIGNGDYSKNPLTNTLNDAYDVSESFINLGYSVTTVINGNKQDMEVAVSDVSNNLTEGSMVVFYYAGHAAQVDKSNFLIPVNEDINSSNDLKYKSVNLDWILGEFKASSSRTNIVILDSCRDNPFKDSTRGGSRGLNVISAPASSGTQIRNTAIIYATTDGNTADDGDGRNSPFTVSFLKYVNSPNETILDVMTNVTQDVFRNSGGRQEPTMINALKEKVYFSDPSSINIIPTPTFQEETLGSIVTISNSSGELYLDGNFIGFLEGNREFTFYQAPGNYSLEYLGEDYSEIINIDVIVNKITPVKFNIPIFNSGNSLTDIDKKIVSLTNEKDLLEIKSNNLEKDIESEEEKLNSHLQGEDSRNSRNDTSINSGWFSFFSYLGAGVCGYLAYDSYKTYQEADSDSAATQASQLFGNLLIATGGATVSGLISGGISKYNANNVDRYDLQKKIISANINRYKKDLLQSNRDYEDVLTQIVSLQRRRDSF